MLRKLCLIQCSETSQNKNYNLTKKTKMSMLDGYMIKYKEIKYNNYIYTKLRSISRYTEKLHDIDISKKKVQFSYLSDEISFFFKSIKQT